MSYAHIKARLDAGKVIILDGATGTELQRRGATMDPAGWCGPATLHNDRLLTDIHADYIRHGSDVVTANTFASGRLMLEQAGYGPKFEEINRRAVDAALRARDITDTVERVAVAGSLSHMVPVSAGTDVVDPDAVPSEQRMVDAFNELAQLLATSGVDHIILEMMYNPHRTAIALQAALATGLPVWFGMSARRDSTGRAISFDLLDDYQIAEIAGQIPATGVDVAGFMHTSSEIIDEALDLAQPHFDGPWMVYPDSGYFEMPDWQFVDTISPSRLAEFYRSWLGRGVQLIGGCCGLTIGHIEAAAAVRSELYGE